MHINNKYLLFDFFSCRYSCYRYLAGASLPRFTTVKKASRRDPELCTWQQGPEYSQTYLAAFHHRRQWAITHSIPVFPVKQSFLVLYLQNIADSAKFKSAVEETVSAITWAHQMAGVPSPTESTFVQSTLQGLQRKLAKPVVKKLPVTVAMFCG